MKSNEIRLVGNLVSDPQVINDSFARARIATNTRWGESERSCFLDIKLFGPAFSDYNYYEPVKGDKVCVLGELVQEEWVDKEGNNRSSYVVYCNSLLKAYKRSKV